jgi:hypothetical protein
MKLQDVVAVILDLPEQNLYKGQVGTIVEVYEPEVFEVEFVDSQGKTYAVETLCSYLFISCMFFVLCIGRFVFESIASTKRSCTMIL